MKKQDTSEGIFRDITVVKPDSAFLGMTYGAIISSWSNWEHSDQPDSNDGNHILFLRSNIETLGGPSSYHDRTGVMAININQNTSVLIPVFVAQYHIVSYYKGTKIDSEIGARRAVREHIREGREMWALMREKSEPTAYQKIQVDLGEYYVESPVFRLTVSERNPFKDKLPAPIQPGTYDAVLGGYFILMKIQKPADYLIWFGANGPGMIHSEAYYQINVRLVPEYVAPGRGISGKDVSGEVLGREKIP